MEKTNKKGQELIGVVSSDKMNKTIVVSVARYVKDPKYGKYMTVHKKYKAHDATNKYKVGDKVTIREVKPISKDKKFEVV